MLVIDKLVSYTIDNTSCKQFFERYKITYFLVNERYQLWVFILERISILTIKNDVEKVSSQRP